MDKKYILYKALECYYSKDDMIHDLKHIYGIEDLEGCDENEISSILDYYDIKFEIIQK